MATSSIVAACLQSYAGGVPLVKDFVSLETIGDRLRRVREGQNLSVRALSELLTAAGYEVSHGSVSSYEMDDARLPALYAVYFCDLFNIDLRWLLTGEGTMEDRPPTDAEKLVAEIRKLIQIRPDQLKRLNSRDKASNDH